MLELITAAAEWLNPETILINGGFWLLILIIFLESGIFFGFFLPGDSLLLMAGILCGSVYLNVSIYQLFLGLSIAGSLGATVGYVFGKKAGGYLLSKKENLFFKKEYLEIAEDYYQKFGKMAFVISRFLPIARTFVPILAGLINSGFGTFLWVNILGTTLWVAIFVFGGFWLGNMFPGVLMYKEFLVIFLILITSIPIVLSWFKRHKQQSQPISKKII